LFTGEPIGLINFYKTLKSGADPRGGGRTIFAPPSAIGNNMIFWRKILFLHTEYPQNFRASFGSA
jgi:hypothetical protein